MSGTTIHDLKGWRQLVPLLVVLLLSACDSGDKATKIDLSDTLEIAAAEVEVAPIASSDTDRIYYFGFDLRGSPSEDARQYLPFLRYLEQATGYDFELKFTPKGQSTGEALGKGQVQFAAIGATSFILAHEQYDVVGLVRGLNPYGKAVYQSMIVVAPDSPIKKVAQLGGKRFAFGSVDSTQGHLIPRILLGEAGLGLDDLGAYEYTGSHRNCANAVISGKYQACGMQDTMARDLAQQGLLRILKESPNFPSSGIAAHAGVPAEVREKVRTALLAFEPEGRHKEVLYHWQKTEMPKGFTTASHEDYDALRHWMIEFGLLQPRVHQHGAME